MKKGETLSPFKEIYTDKLGNKWFEYKNINHLPAKRALIAMLYSRYANLRVTPERMSAILDEMEKLFDQGKFMRAGSLVQELRMSEDLYCEPETLKRFASVYYFLEEEEPETYNEIVLQAKEDIWEQDEDCMYFFLQKAWEHTTNYSTNSKLNLREYFQKVMVVLERLKKYPVTKP